MASPRSDWASRSALVVLVGGLALLVVPVIFWSHEGETSEAGDERRFHEPTIRAMAEAWPNVDLVHYSSATTPGYHLAMSLVARYITDGLIGLRLVSAMFTAALLLVVHRQLCERFRPWLTLAMMLPLLASSYVLGAASWLVTDNAALLFVVLALGACVLDEARESRLHRAGLWSTLAVFVRQIHVWTAAPIVWTAIIARRWRAVFAALAPIAIVVIFGSLWRGLTPPDFADVNPVGVNPAVAVLSLALMGSFGIFFLPLGVERWCDVVPRQRGPWLAGLITASLSVLVPTSYDFEAGRWGGAVWELAKIMPVIGGRSLPLVALAALGGAVLAILVERAVRAGRSQQVFVLLVALAAWMCTQTANTLAFQRYCEPLILLFLLWFSILGASERRVARHAWLGPTALGVAQLGLSGYTLYMPVFA